MLLKLTALPSIKTNIVRKKKIKCKKKKEKKKANGPTEKGSKKPRKCQVFLLGFCDLRGLRVHLK